MRPYERKLIPMKDELISSQLLHILYDELIAFYADEENQKAYERWRDGEENINEIQEERT